MNAKAISEATLGLLLYAEREGFELTSRPIVVEASDLGHGYTVTLHACRRNGDDCQIRIGVEVGGIVPMGVHRHWSALEEAMGPWTAFDALQIGARS